MIRFRQKGDFSKLTRFLEKAKEVVHLGDLDRFGRAGVAALASATPVDSGETARSWYYEISNKKGSVTISFHNSNIQNGVPIAIILQYGPWYWNRRLGRRARLHQPRYPAYF